MPEKTVNELKAEIKREVLAEVKSMLRESSGLLSKLKMLHSIKGGGIKKDGLHLKHFD